MVKIPTVTAVDVEKALQRLRAGGFPRDADSTKYVVVDPETGAEFPPKFTLSLAVEAATGLPFSRRLFSGGDQTNAILQQLGYEIRPKTGTTTETTTIAEIKPGDVITNDQLTTAFRVGNSGGMRWSGAEQCLVVIADHTKSLYDDRWDGDVLRYTGMGRIGDQQLAGQNLRLAEQPRTDIAVHLFEVFTQNAYRYAGRVELAGSAEWEHQPDDEGNPRRVLVFPLKLRPGSLRPIPQQSEVLRITRDRQRSLAKLSNEELAKRALDKGKLTPGKRETITVQYERNEAVAALAKRLANAKCDLCSEPAPFTSKDGPYLECHHIHHLAQGGPDTISNTVALCANCHRKMHVLDLASDRERLLKRISERSLLE
jgi:5-methylcytosine-specific restriction protein A